jgi:hypothetical protein
MRSRWPVPSAAARRSVLLQLYRPSRLNRLLGRLDDLDDSNVDVKGGDAFDGFVVFHGIDHERNRVVLVQREMENWRSPLASIPPSSAGQLGEHRATQVATGELGGG